MYARVLIDNNTRDERLAAEWGLAVWIETEGHKLLLDTGSGGKFVENADTLGLPMEEIECGVLSHAHYDHADGLAAFFARNQTAPFYLREGTCENCYGQEALPEKEAPTTAVPGKIAAPRQVSKPVIGAFRPGIDILPAVASRFYYKYIGIRQGTLAAYEDRIRYANGDQEILPGVTLVPHKTPGLEAVGEKAKMYLKDGENWLPDAFAHEQSLVVDTKDGLVIFNSCSHGGADTIIREIHATWPQKRIAALVGGLHLFRSSEAEVRALAERVRELSIGKIYTGHCTGSAALQILREELEERVEEIYAGLEIRIG